MKVFDPDKDLDPICLYAFQPNVLVVNPALPVKSVAELIVYAKAHPHQLNYASGGVGSTSHVAGELFKTMAGLEWQHVPYRGTGRRSCRTSKAARCGACHQHR